MSDNTVAQILVACTPTVNEVGQSRMSIGIRGTYAPNPADWAVLVVSLAREVDYLLRDTHSHGRGEFMREVADLLKGVISEKYLEGYS